MTDQNKNKTLIIAVYSHVEAYPPSLNALHHLARQYEKVYVLMRNVMESDWSYPDNVVCIEHGEFVSAERIMGLSYKKKLSYFISFGFRLRSLIKELKPTLVLTYDAAAFALLNVFCQGILKKTNTRVWYHNHDVTHEDELPRFSLMWLIRKTEIKFFSRADFFTLPNSVRLSYFPVHLLCREPVILPNYPSTSFYGKWNALPPAPGNVLRLIFQGHINKSNGIEELVSTLSMPVMNNKLELHLAGPIHADFKELLQLKAAKLGVADQLFFYGRLPYAKLPDLTASCHIGIAIYGEHNTMVRTMSTASNKIFEYASVGLPVIINKRNDMETEFASHSWIHFVSLDTPGLQAGISRIMADYAGYSTRAKNDFIETLNFEHHFLPFMKLLNNP